jgi:hypothetical protein
MATESEKKAKASEYKVFATPRPYSFELNMDLMKLLRDEFDPPLVVGKFTDSIGNKKEGEIAGLAEKFFKEHGERWMKKTVRLGEEYPDRTYEVLKEVADETGELVFPLVVQRFIEIAYLSTQKFRVLPIVENWGKRLIYKVPDCYMFAVIKEKCGPAAAGALPCRHACLELCNSICRHFNSDALVKMESTMVDNNFCQFAISKTI